MKKIILLLVIILIAITFCGCAQKDSFIFNGVTIELKCKPSTQPTWYVYQVTKENVKISPSGYLTDAKIFWVFVQTDKGEWYVPTDPKNGQILDQKIFDSYYNKSGVSSLMWAQDFFVKNKDNLQYILTTLYTCPQLKEIDLQCPWGKKAILK